MNPTIHILLIDDDLEICQLLQDFLQKHAYQVTVQHDGKNLENLLTAQSFDLIILDIMLPGDDGFTVCRKIRSHCDIPIIMLTAVNSEADRVAGLETGADDYLAKPFSPRELLARIKVILRRLGVSQARAQSARFKLLPLPLIRFAGWTLDQNKRRLLAPDGLVVELSTGEYDLLVAFVTHPQRVLTRDQLLNLTREREAIPFDRSIDVQVGRLRRKIKSDTKNPEIIKTIRGEGYQFTARVEKE